MAQKKKKKNAGPPKPLVQLSQCMIVKNEEHNIERALRWAKGIAFEQIVVDTGSADRTAVIAESMGAKVYHFEWCNDFSKAKNFAIEQASGNWIAFLDADEYFTPEDAKHMLYCLKQITADPEMKSRWHAINTPWAHVDENGKPFAIQDQERIFRSFTRYTGMIHESINIPAENIAHIDEVTIIHTGYSRGVLDKTQKAERNIKMLRDYLKDNPGDENAKIFLADSLAATSDAENIAEAEMLFYESIRGNTGNIMPAMKRKAYTRLIRDYESMPRKIIAREELCRKALIEFPGDIDINYYLGQSLNIMGKHSQAWEVLKECERMLGDKNALTDSEIISANPALLYKQLEITAKALGDTQSLAKYEQLSQ